MVTGGGKVGRWTVAVGWARCEFEGCLHQDRWNALESERQRENECKLSQLQSRTNPAFEYDDTQYLREWTADGGRSSVYL